MGLALIWLALVPMGDGGPCLETIGGTDATGDIAEGWGAESDGVEQREQREGEGWVGLDSKVLMPIASRQISSWRSC